MLTPGPARMPPRRGRWSGLGETVRVGALARCVRGRPVGRVPVRRGAGRFRYAELTFVLRALVGSQESWPRQQRHPTGEFGRTASPSSESKRFPGAGFRLR